MKHDSGLEVKGGAVAPSARYQTETSGDPIPYSQRVAQPRVSAFRDDLSRWDGTETAAQVKAGQVSAEEVVAASVARAHELEPDLNAIVSWCDTAGQTPDPEAPLAGVPMLIKDNDPWPGSPTTHGSAATPKRPARTPSAYAAQLAELGFVVIGKSTLPEFGLTASTESVFQGATRNPWNPDHTVGGSSGGSAAMTAAGAVPMAHSNDGRGSIRIPASCAGLVGLKPTRGRLVPADGIETLPINVVTQGMVTRTVRDTVNLFAALEQLRPAADLPPIGSVTGPGDRRLRIGFYTASFGGVEPDPETVDLVQETGAKLEGLGHHVEAIPHPFDDRVAKDFLRYWSMLAFMLSRFGKRVFGEGFEGDQVGPFTTGLARLFSDQIPRIPFAIRRIQAFEADYEACFDKFDVLLSPVLTHRPPPLGYLGPEVEFHEHLVRLTRYAGHTSYHNIAGAPALSFPAGLSRHGVPIGMQLAAPGGQDRRLLELAFELELSSQRGEGAA